MIKTNVYRTTKGNLTFKKTGEVIFTIRATTFLGAQEMLEMLKKVDKKKNTENYDGGI